MTSVNLYTRSVIRFGGDDAQKLLNDTLTGHIDGSMAGEGRWFALLSPQGKVLVEGLMTFADGAFWAEIEAGYVADFIKRMSMYRLRAKVTIEDLSSTYIVVWSPEAGMSGTVYRDMRHSSLGQRAIVDHAHSGGLAGEHAVEAGAVDPYHAARIAAGISEMGDDYGTNEVFAHDIGMDILDGIDFAKGCYVGQEVVSRMKHRGTARRRPVIVSGIEATVGAAVAASGREAGTVGAVVDGKAVSILRLDRITDVDAVTVAGKLVTVKLPEWATYRFGEVSAEE